MHEGNILILSQTIILSETWPSGFCAETKVWPFHNFNHMFFYCSQQALFQKFTLRTRHCIFIIANLTMKPCMQIYQKGLKKWCKKGPDQVPVRGELGVRMCWTFSRKNLSQKVANTTCRFIRWTKSPLHINANATPCLLKLIVPLPYKLTFAYTHVHPQTST